MDPVTVTACIASVGTLFTIIFDKMRNSRCTHIACCGCIDIERDVVDDD